MRALERLQHFRQTEEVLSFTENRILRGQWRWIVNAPTDIVSAFAWAPVFCVAHLLTGNALRTWASLVFLFSLVHQAITPILLATDRPTRSRHRIIYGGGIPTVALGSWLLLQAGLGWVALIAAGWNLLHTLRQRYGIVRLYGSQGGQLRRPIEQGLIFGPFLGAAGLALWLPGTLDSVDRLGFGGINAEIVSGIRSLARFAPLVLFASVLWTGLTVKSLQRDRHQRPPSNTKRLYLGAYFLSLGCAVFDPAAGVIALVAAHSFEYFFALDATLERRFGRQGTLLHRLIAAVRHRRAFLVVCATCCAVLILTARSVLATTAYLVLYMTIGGTHFLFDGFMWRSNKAPAS